MAFSMALMEPLSYGDTTTLEERPALVAMKHENPDLESFVHLALPAIETETALATLTRAPRQRETLARLLQNGNGTTFPLAALRDEGLGDAAVVKALVRRGLLVVERREALKDRTEPFLFDLPLLKDVHHPRQERHDEGRVGHEDERSVDREEDAILREPLVLCGKCDACEQHLVGDVEREPRQDRTPVRFGRSVRYDLRDLLTVIDTLKKARP